MSPVCDIYISDTDQWAGCWKRGTWTPRPPWPDPDQARCCQSSAALCTGQGMSSSFCKRQLGQKGSSPGSELSALQKSLVWRQGPEYNQERWVWPLHSHSADTPATPGVAGGPSARPWVRRPGCLTCERRGTWRSLRGLNCRRGEKAGDRFFCSSDPSPAARDSPPPGHELSVFWPPARIWIPNRHRHPNSLLNGNLSIRFSKNELLWSWTELTQGCWYSPGLSN